MASISLQNLRSADLQGSVRRLMRPQNLTVLATTLQYLALAIAGLCLILSAYWIINSFLIARNASLTLQNKIQQTIAASKEQTVSSDRGPDVTKVIVQRAVFGALGKGNVPVAGPTPPPPTPLSLTLIGTFLTGGDQPYAIIEDKKKQSQEVFIVSQSIFGQATLKAIFEDRVEIVRDGKVEVLRLDDLGGDAPAPGGGIASSGTDEFVVEEAEVDKALENLPLLLTQARAVPYFKDGRAIGLRLFAIKSGSLYEKIGMKNGDILKAINGNSLADLSQALRLFEQLKQERSISVMLERDRADREFRYQIR